MFSNCQVISNFYNELNYAITEDDFDSDANTIDL